MNDAKARTGTVVVLFTQADALAHLNNLKKLQESAKLAKATEWEDCLCSTVNVFTAMMTVIWGKVDA